MSCHVACFYRLIPLHVFLTNRGGLRCLDRDQTIRKREGRCSPDLRSPAMEKTAAVLGFGVGEGSGVVQAAYAGEEARASSRITAEGSALSSGNREVSPELGGAPADAMTKNSALRL